MVIPASKQAILASKMATLMAAISSVFSSLTGTVIEWIFAADMVWVRESY